LIPRRLHSGLLLVLMAIGSFSLWTVVPLGWIWIASQLTNTQQPHFSSYMLVLFGIVASVFVIAKGLAALNRRYLALSGTEEGTRIPLPWMRSMRDEQRAIRATALDIVLVTSAVVAILCMVVWFFVIAGSPLPGQ
jgi:hypothetical protein